MTERAENLADRLARLSRQALRSATADDMVSARAGVARMRARIAAGAFPGEPEEIEFVFDDPWSERLFLALCRRYGLRPVRCGDDRPHEFVAVSDARFVERVFWPDYNALAVELDIALHETTDVVIERLRRGSVGAASTA